MNLASYGKIDVSSGAQSSYLTECSEEFVSMDNVSTCPMRAVAEAGWQGRRGFLFNSTHVPCFRVSKRDDSPVRPLLIHNGSDLTQKTSKQLLRGNNTIHTCETRAIRPPDGRTFDQNSDSIVYMMSNSSGTQRPFTNYTNKCRFCTHESNAVLESNLTANNNSLSGSNYINGFIKSRTLGKEYSEKMTYCRPVLRFTTREFLKKTYEQNNKLHYLVKRIIQARQKEKESLWNNYRFTSTDAEPLEQYEAVPERVATKRIKSPVKLRYFKENQLEDHVIDVIGTNDISLNTGPYVNESRMRAKMHCRDNPPFQLLSQDRHEEVFVYPMSSQGRLAALKKNNLLTSPYNMKKEEFKCNHGTQYANQKITILNESPHRKKNRLNDEIPHKEDCIDNYDDDQPRKKRNRRQKQKKSIEDSTNPKANIKVSNDAEVNKKTFKDIYTQYDSDGNPFNKQKKSCDKATQYETNSEGSDSDRLESQDQSSQDQSSKEPSSQDESTKDKYKTVSENVARLKKQIEENKQGPDDNCLDNIENKLDTLVKTIYSLLDDWKRDNSLDAIPLPQPEKCDFTKCIATHPFTLSDLEEETERDYSIHCCRNIGVGTEENDNDYSSICSRVRMKMGEKKPPKATKTVAVGDDTVNDNESKETSTTEISTSSDDIPYDERPGFIGPRRETVATATDSLICTTQAVATDSPRVSNPIDRSRAIATDSLHVSNPIDRTRDIATDSPHVSNLIGRTRALATVSSHVGLAVPDQDYEHLLDQYIAPEPQPPNPKRSKHMCLCDPENPEMNVNDETKQVLIVTNRSMNTFRPPLVNSRRAVGQDAPLSNIISEELNKSNRAKQDIIDILNRELYKPCGIRISFDEPSNDRATEVTSSLSGRNIYTIGTAAVNTEPLSILSLLRVSTDTIKQMLGNVRFDYMSLLPLTQLSAKPEVPKPRFYCNVCGMPFHTSKQLCDHVLSHDLCSTSGFSKDCCVCRHSITRRPRTAMFGCRYCGQCFARAYCRQLHEQTCAQCHGQRTDVSENLAFLR